jgi:hypothetical protein
MINHKYKCIFIHIQRTGGTSIERAIQGEDQYDKFRATKHILASTAKKIHADYWDDYYKFSFVRNPWDRAYSFAKMKWFKTNITNNIVNLDNYVNYINDKKYELPGFSESYNRLHKIDYSKHINNAVYLNILDEELDFIGKFENLQDDFQKVCNNIGLKTDLKMDNGVIKVDTRFDHYSNYYNDKSIEQVRNLHKKDIERFNYAYNNK